MLILPRQFAYQLDVPIWKKEILLHCFQYQYAHLIVFD